MDCQEFELIVADLARFALTDTKTRREAMLHAETCTACAQRLTHERALTDALRRVAEVDSHELAAARVEAHLLDAFRAMHAKTANANATAQISSVAPFASHRNRARTRKHFVIGGAAIGALAACLALIFFAPRASQPNNAVKDNLQALIQPATFGASPSISKSNGSILETKDSSKDKSRAVNIAQKISSVPRHRVHRSSPVVNSPANAHSDDVSNLNSSGEEIATDFLTLTPTTLDMLEGGQIVRLELPHSALAAFGLMINGARADEKVKADVVLSADGVARAIRFVR